MNAHPRETLFSRHLIRYYDSDGRGTLEESITQLQRDERCVQRFASVMALVPLLAIAAVGYGTMLQETFPYDEPHPVIRILWEMGLASLICLVALTGLLMGYHRKLKRAGEKRLRLTTRLLEPQWDKPEIAMLPGSDRGADDREASEGAAAFSDYQGSLQSPSWRSSRLCG
jgi:hypothetical protein